jgi:hypothetical protein
MQFRLQPGHLFHSITDSSCLWSRKRPIWFSCQFCRQDTFHFARWYLFHYQSSVLKVLKQTITSLTLSKNSFVNWLDSISCCHGLQNKLETVTNISNCVQIWWKATPWWNEKLQACLMACRSLADSYTLIHFV